MNPLDFVRSYFCQGDAVGKEAFLYRLFTMDNGLSVNAQAFVFNENCRFRWRVLAVCPQGNLIPATLPCANVLSCCLGQKAEAGFDAMWKVLMTAHQQPAQEMRTMRPELYCDAVFPFAEVLISSSKGGPLRQKRPPLRKDVRLCNI